MDEIYQLEALKQEITTLKDDYSNLLDTLSSLKKREDSNVQNIKQWSDKFAKALERRLKHIEKEIDKLAKNPNVNRELEQNRNLIKKLEKRMKILENEKREMEQKYERLNQSHEKLVQSLRSGR